MTTSGALTTSSVTGTTLSGAGANAVGAFNAANSTSGNVSLTNGGALSVTGITQSGSGSVSVASTGANTALTVNGSVTSGGGPVTLQATGNLIVSANQTISSGSGALTLGADLTAAGAGDDGVGTLTINAGASVSGGQITLRGANEDIASTASVGSSSSTSQVTIQSSVESRPMSIGGSNNAAVAGINLTSAELARIATTSSGRRQHRRQQPDGEHHPQQRHARHDRRGHDRCGSVFRRRGSNHPRRRRGAGPALSGNGGAIDLTAGAGGIVEDGTNVAATADLGNATSVSMTSGGAIGSSSQPLQLTSTSLTTNTSANNNNQYFSVLSGDTVSAESLNAGAGTIYFLNGNVSAGASGAIASASSLNIGAGAAFDLNGNSQTTANLNGSGTITDSGAAATLTVNTTAADTFAGALTGANLSLTAGGSGTLTLTGNNSYGGATTVNSGATLQVGNGGATGTLGAGAVTDNGSLVFDHSNNISVGNAISGSGSLTQSGTGTLTLTTAETYTGGTNVTSGTLADGVANALPTGTALNVSNGATFDLNGDSQQVGSVTGTGTVTDGGAAATLTVNDSSADAFAGSLTGANLSLDATGSSTLTLTGANTYGARHGDQQRQHAPGRQRRHYGNAWRGAVTDNGSLVFDHGNNISVGNAISGSGSLTQSGTATLTLTTTETYTGGTTINSGATLADGVANALPTGTALTDNGVFDLMGYAQQVGSVTGTGIVTDSGAAANFTVANSAADSYAGTLTGSLNLVDAGASTLTLSNAGNTYTGSTTVNSGATLADGVANALPTGTALADNGILDLMGHAQQVAGVTGSGIVTDSGAAANFTVANGTVDSYAGKLTGSLNLVDGGTSTLTLSNAGNTYTGSTTVNSGATLADGVANALPTGTALADNGTLDLKGYAQQVGSVTGTGAVTDSGAAANFTVANSSADSYAGTLTGSLNLVDGGTSTLTLSNAGNTYTGSTTVNSGATLADGVANALPTGTALADNGILDLMGHAQQVAGVTGSGTVTDSGAAANFTVANGTVDSYAGKLTGSLNLVDAGTSTLTLSNAGNTYTGSTTVNSGATLADGVANALPTGTALTDNGILDLMGHAQQVAGVTGSGIVTDSGAAANFTVANSSADSYAGSVDGQPEPGGRRHEHADSEQRGQHVHRRHHHQQRRHAD